MKGKKLHAVRLLEEKLKGASPSECAKITRMLVQLKDELINH